MDETERLVWSSLEALPVRDAYALLQLRVDVFVVEQACPYRELDGRDFEARHLRALVGGTLAGALRLFEPQAGAPARIGRVVVAKPFRGSGLGERLMRAALRECRGGPVDLAAQAPLERFYAGFGFAPIRSPYLEDGIPHIHMRLPVA